MKCLRIHLLHAGIACFFACFPLPGQAQTLVLSMESSGRLSWTNTVGAAQYRVEWAHHPAGPWWSTWDHLSVIPATNGVMRVNIPAYFRVAMLRLEDLDGDHDGFSPRQGDCDDGDPGVNPGAAETCNGKDDDCDGLVDSDDGGLVGGSLWFRDEDADGFGNPAVTQVACDAPSGFVNVAGDCDDIDPDVNPGAPETCNGKDDDCDGLVDSDDGGVVGGALWFRDADGDGFGDPAVTRMACDAPSGFVSIAGDCDDINAGINPDATETAEDGIDQNCNGSDDD